MDSSIHSTMEVEEEVRDSIPLMAHQHKQVCVCVCACVRVCVPVEAFLAGSVPCHLESLQAHSNGMVSRHSQLYSQQALHWLCITCLAAHGSPLASVPGLPRFLCAF